MRKFLLLVVMGQLIGFSLQSQTDPKLSVFSFNPMFYNPAFAGAGGGLSAIGIHSSQYVGFEGAPQTQYFTVHGLWEENNLGIGLDMINDQFGAVKETGFNGNLAYYLRLNSQWKFSFGMKAGMTSISVDYSQLNIFDPDEDIIQDRQFNMLQPNLGFGFYLFTERFYLGLSSPNIFLSDRYEPFEVGVSPADAAYYLMGGLNLPLMNEVTLIPNVLIRTLRGAPRSALFSLNVDFFEQAFIGFNWEYKSSLGLAVGFLFDEKFRAGYAFDFPTNGLGRYTNGTHTLFISYNLDKFKRASNMPCFYY